METVYHYLAQEHYKEYNISGNSATIPSAASKIDKDIYHKTDVESVA